MHDASARARYPCAARSALFAQCRFAGRNARRGAVQCVPAGAESGFRRTHLFLRACHAANDLAPGMASASKRRAGDDAGCACRARPGSHCGYVRPHVRRRRSCARKRYRIVHMCCAQEKLPWKSGRTTHWRRPWAARCRTRPAVAITWRCLAFAFAHWMRPENLLQANGVKTGTGRGRIAFLCRRPRR